MSIDSLGASADDLAMSVAIDADDLATGARPAFPPDVRSPQNKVQACLQKQEIEVSRRGKCLLVARFHHSRATAGQRSGGRDAR
jgi:hypothetical protein